MKLPRTLATGTAWGTAGQALGHTIGNALGVSEPTAIGALVAALAVLAAVIGWLPGKEQKPTADLQRCLARLGTMYFNSQIRDEEYETLRKQCLAAYEKASHE